MRPAACLAVALDRAQSRARPHDHEFEVHPPRGYKEPPRPGRARIRAWRKRASQTASHEDEDYALHTELGGEAKRLVTHPGEEIGRLGEEARAGDGGDAGDPDRRAGDLARAG